MLHSTRLSDAYRTLFGHRPVSLNDLRLDTDLLRRVHRRRAFELHPDRARQLGRCSHELESDLKDVNAAYETLRRAAPKADSRSPESPTPQSQPASAFKRTPARVLPFGEYLYYTQRVGWTALVDAIAWQRRQRPMMGELARQSGLLDGFAVSAVVRGRDRHERFGECAVRLGYLTEVDLERLLATQYSMQDRIGQYFVQLGVARARDIDRFAADQRAHNRKYQKAA